MDSGCRRVGVGGALKPRKFNGRVSRFGMQMHRRLSGDALPEDLVLGFEPITKGIPFASGLQTLLENLIRPLADLRVRTDAYHGLLLPLWVTGGTPVARRSTSGTFLDGPDQTMPSVRVRRGFYQIPASLSVSCSCARCASSR